jgi:hypothetical protein
MQLTTAFLQDSDQFYTDSDEYFYIKYLDKEDKLGYENGSKFEYKVNKDYFRNDHFNKNNQQLDTVLAIGCSITFGHGLPEEFCWPRLLEKNIQKTNQTASVINLGSLGLGISSIINNTMSFISKYGKPKTILALFPSISREFIFDKKSQNYVNFLPDLSHLKNPKESELFFNKTKNYVFEDVLYQTVNQIRMFEQFCRSSNINLIWSSWQKSDLKIYRELNFDNYYDSEYFVLGTAPKTDMVIDSEYLKYAMLARDKSHPGIRYSKDVSLGFLKRLEQND